MRMSGIELAAALGVAEAGPVGGAVASTCEALFFDEGFEEDGAIAVSAVPISGEASCGKP